MSHVLAAQPPHASPTFHSMHAPHPIKGRVLVPGVVWWSTKGKGMTLASATRPDVPRDSQPVSDSRRDSLAGPVRVVSRKLDRCRLTFAEGAGLRRGRTGRRGYDAVGVVVVLDGQMKIIQGGRRAHLGPGDGVVFRSTEAHHFEVSPRGAIVCCELEADRGQLKRGFDKLRLTVLPAATCFPTDLAHVVRQCLHTADTDAITEDLVRASIECLMSEALVQAARQHAAETDRSSDGVA
jgi:ribosomal protein S14